MRKIFLKSCYLSVHAKGFKGDVDCMMRIPTCSCWWVSLQVFEPLIRFRFQKVLSRRFIIQVFFDGLVYLTDYLFIVFIAILQLYCGKLQDFAPLFRCRKGLLNKTIFEIQSPPYVFWPPTFDPWLYFWTRVGGKFFKLNACELSYVVQKYGYNFS